MISRKGIKALLNSAPKERKEAVITELFSHMAFANYYNEAKASHILEMLFDCDAAKTINDINLDYVKQNLNLLMYNHKKYDIKDIKVDNVDNIEGEVRVSFKYLEKVNEERTDVTYNNSSSIISYLDYPDILK